VGVLLATPNIDDLFDPARNEEMAFAKKPDIGGPQERAISGIFQISVKRRFRLDDAPPVAVCNARTGNPDFADFIRPALDSSVRICNHGTSVARGAAAGADGGGFCGAHLRYFHPTTLQG